MDTPPTTPTTPDAPSGAESTKKYIRTFAGDMETLKKGGTPDLTPLEKPTPLKTYSDDFSQRVKETHASTATVLAAEQDAASGTPAAAMSRSHGNVLFIIAGTVLLLLGGSGTYIAYTRYLTNVQPVILAPTIATPIFVDEREEISGATPAAIRQAIEQSIIRPLAPNTVRLLYTDLGTTTDKSIFSALELPAPDVLLRNVNSTHSMAGIVNADGNQSLFFILSVASYGDTFAGMLSWEPTMTRDLNTLFPQYPTPIISTTTVATTTVATSTQISTVSFHDEVVNNHDVRIYRDAERRSVLVYGYWNQTTLVIAWDVAAFTEILGRLATSRAQ